jgi:hypothetical protein
VINRRTGAGGEQFGIHFALAMPEKLNGDFLMVKFNKRNKRDQFQMSPAHGPRFRQPAEVDRAFP